MKGPALSSETEDLIGWAALAALGVGIWLCVKYWQISVPVLAVLIPVAIYMYLRHRRRAKERRDAEQRSKDASLREETRRQHAKEQAEISEQAQAIFCTALDLRGRAQGHVAKAASSLDQAEREFAERAFAPFWTAVEDAANCLASVDAAINDIAAQHDKYAAVVQTLDSRPAVFAVDTSELSAALPVAARLSAIVRAAQTDFQFATIFEQRKTNQILVRGFGGLASALAQMSERLGSSLEQLEWTLAESTEAVTAIQQRIKAR